MHLEHSMQGDVALVKVAALEEGLELKAIPREGLVVALGEVSCHYHRVETEEGTEVTFAEKDGKFYLSITGGNAVITHQEHATQTLTPGFYHIYTQVEYDDLEEMRKVQD